jgi:uncharacterized protein
MFDPRFALIGLIIGFLIGLTGMGGGSLMTPVMILVMGVKPVIAVGTDLAYGAITKIVGGAAHFRQDTVNRRTAYLLALGSVPASVLGVGLVTRIKAVNPGFVDLFLTRAIAWALILVAIVLVAQPMVTKRHADAIEPESVDFRDRFQALGDRLPWLLPPIGAVVGFLVGLTSVGSGTLIVMTLFFLYPRWHLKDLVGTDVFHAAMLVSAAAAAQMVAGNVNIGMTLSLLVGSIPGVLVGSKLVIRIPQVVLRVTLAGVLLISGAKLL